MRTMKQLRIHLPRQRRARGFSLVEILVGVAIGIVGMLVIFKTIATWDTHTRSTTAGSDAQTTGSLAMFNLERDIKQAGQGFMGIGVGTPGALGCAVSGVDTQTGRALAFDLAPVRIGVTVARTLAWTWEVPLLGLHSLTALALNAGWQARPVSELV